MVHSLCRVKKGAQHVIILVIFVVSIINTAVLHFFVAQNQSLENDKRPGVIVLGMHRSGTSMLSGVLVEGFGYETGGPLLAPQSDNEKVRLLIEFQLDTYIGILLVSCF